MTFGEKLTRLRKREGMSQESLAEKLGVSRQAVSRWEQGTALPDAAKLLPCARLFQVDVEWLLDDARGWEDQTRSAESARGTETPAAHGNRRWGPGPGGHGDLERCLSRCGLRDPFGGGLGPGV